MRKREEVLNTVLAQAISARAIEADPETIQQRENRRDMPDVLFDFLGLHCLIEGKIADTASADTNAENAAQERLDLGICQVSIAVVYPSELRKATLAQMSKSIAATALQYKVLTDSGSTKWRHGDLDDLLDDMRRAYDLLIAEDVVQRSVSILQAGMDPLIDIIKGRPASGERLAQLLGVYEPDRSSSETD